jgi:hypothetical protein
MVRVFFLILFALLVALPAQAGKGKKPRQEKKCVVGPYKSGKIKLVDVESDSALCAKHGDRGQARRGYWGREKVVYCYLAPEMVRCLPPTYEGGPDLPFK